MKLKGQAKSAEQRHLCIQVLRNSECHDAGKGEATVAYLCFADLAETRRGWPMRFNRFAGLRASTGAASNALTVWRQRSASRKLMESGARKMAGQGESSRYTS